MSSPFIAVLREDSTFYPEEVLEKKANGKFLLEFLKRLPEDKEYKYSFFERIFPKAFTGKKLVLSGEEILNIAKEIGFAKNIDSVELVLLKIGEKTHTALISKSYNTFLSQNADFQFIKLMNGMDQVAYRLSIKQYYISA